MRLPLAAVITAVLFAGLPALPASAEAPQLRVTAVVRDEHGHLTFRRGHAAGEAAAQSLADRWQRDSSVLAAEVDHRIRISGAPDPLAPQQWALTTLRSSEIGDATGQVVAVVDTGVDAAHPDLSGVVLAGTDLVSPGGDGRSDPNGHGTHVSGIVAAVGNNGIGGAGLAQGAKILPVRVMAADGTGSDSDAAAGVVWAADHGATVINLSFGGPDPSSVMDSAVQYALNKGVSVVVAAGNEATATSDPVEWPAADPGVIAVGAVDSTGARPSWSSSGPHLALAAPGVGILSTVPITATNPTGYATWSGTSMAAPFVSAAAALLRHAQPISGDAVRQRLMQTADDLGPAGFDNLYGAGRVDIYAAEGNPAAVTSASPSPTPTATVDPAATAPTAAPTAASTDAPTDAPTMQPTATAPAAEPGPTPQVTAPTAAPPTAPAPTTPAPATVAPAPTPTPVAAIAPFMTARLSASRTVTTYAGAVIVSTRLLADGLGSTGADVQLQRQVNGAWVPTRGGLTGAGGLASWVLHPDRTTYYRAVGSGWTSPLVRIVVTPGLSLHAATGGVTGRILPASVGIVRVDQRYGASWVPLTSTRSAADGTFRLTRRLPVGTVLRAVWAGVASPPAMVGAS